MAVANAASTSAAKAAREAESAEVDAFSRAANKASVSVVKVEMADATMEVYPEEEMTEAYLTVNRVVQLN